ncbi:hypothetical protein GGF32_000022 [Allomyces javanicus]|nr:hypothetical protein GGF32_000022 [Allomyces javanicus]
MGTPAADADPAAASAPTSLLNEDDRATFVLRFRDGFPTQVFPSPGVVEPKSALIANLEDASVLLGRPAGDELLTRLNEAHATRLLDAANSDPNHAHIYHFVASAFVLSQDELAAKARGLSPADVQLLRDAVEAVYQLSTDASTVTTRHVLGRQLQRAHIGTLPPAIQQALVGVPRTDTQLLAPSKDPAIALLNPLRLPKASINKVATILAKTEQGGVGPVTETDTRSTNTHTEDTRGSSTRGRKRGGRVAVIEGVQPPPPPRTTRAPLNPLESVAPTPGYAHDASYSRLYSWFAQGAMAPPATGAAPPPIRSVTAARSSAAAVPSSPFGFASGRVIPPPAPPPVSLAAPAPPVPPADPASWAGAHRPPISTSYSSYALAQAWQASAAVAYVPFPPPPLIPPSLFAPPSSTPPPPPTPVFPFRPPAGAGPVPPSIFAEFGRTATQPLPLHQLPLQLPPQPAPAPVASAIMGAGMVGAGPIAAQPALPNETIRPPLPQQQPFDQPSYHRAVAPHLVTTADGPAEPTAAATALPIASPPPPPPAQPVPCRRGASSSSRVDAVDLPEPVINGQQSIPIESGPVDDAVPPPPTSPLPAAPRRRGRPPKRRAETTGIGAPSAAPPDDPPAAASSSVQGQDAPPAAPKRRGRPPKRRTVTAPSDMPTAMTDPIVADSTSAGPQPTPLEQGTPAPKRRGRPPKRRAEPTLADAATGAAEPIAADSTDAAPPLALSEQPQLAAPAPKRRGRLPKRAANHMAPDEAAANVPESTLAAQVDATRPDFPLPVSPPGVRRSARVRRRSEQLAAAAAVDGLQPRSEASAVDELAAPPAKRRRRASTVRDDAAAHEPDRSAQDANPNMAGPDGLVPSTQVETRLSLSDLLGCGPTSTTPLLPLCAFSGPVEPALAAHSAHPLGVVPPPLTPLAMVSRPATVVNSPAFGHDQAAHSSPGVSFTGVPAPRRFDAMTLGGEDAQSASTECAGVPTTLAALLGVMRPVALNMSEST